MVNDTSSSDGRGVSGNFLEGEDDFYSLVYPDEEKSTTISYEYDMDDDSDCATGSDRSKKRRRMLLNGSAWAGGSGQPQGSEDGSVFIIMQAEMDDQDDDTYREEKEDKIAAIV
jgi:hypothetical protein